LFFFQRSGAHRDLHSFPTRRSSDLLRVDQAKATLRQQVGGVMPARFALDGSLGHAPDMPPLATLRDTLQASNAELTQRRSELERSEEHTSELQSRRDLVCRLLLEKK